MIEGIDPNVWEECTEYQWHISVDKGIKYYDSSIGWLHFKKKSPQKFPKVFEDKSYKFEITETLIKVIDLTDGMNFILSKGHSLDTLKQALKYQEDNS